MKTSLFFFAGLAVSSASLAQPHVVDWANVTNVTPRMERVSVTRQVCETRYLPGARLEPSQPNVGGAILGTVIGGVIGSRFGGGDGRLAATAAGAGLGAVIGSNAGGEAGYGATRPVQDCRNEVTYEMQPNGYLVTYEYMGREFFASVAQDPGRRLRVNVNVTPAP